MEDTPQVLLRRAQKPFSGKIQQDRTIKTELQHTSNEISPADQRAAHTMKYARNSRWSWQVRGQTAYVTIHNKQDHVGLAVSENRMDLWAGRYISLVVTVNFSNQLLW